MAWSASTWKTKTSQWKRFLGFCELAGATPVPTKLNVMCRYAVHLSRSLRYSTIQNYISAVISLNNYFNYDVLYIRSEFTFAMTMSGIRRALGDPEPHRPTLFLEDLHSMFSKVDLASTNELTMWACITLAFRGLLRKSNLVPDSDALKGHYLRRGAVVITNWGMEVKVSSSKTIQYCQKTHRVPITTAQGSPVCAVTWVRKHFADVPSSDPDSPAFMLVGSGSPKPLTYSKLLSFLKTLLARADLESTRVGCHSLRRAGALYMYNLGLSLEDIRQAGDWSSMAALVYLTKPFANRVSTDSVVSKSLSSYASHCKSVL